MLHATEKYLKKGYSVIPVGKDKKPLVRWSQYQEHPPSMEEVTKWLQQFPEMQIGIVTGAVSGLVVIDVEYGGNADMYPRTTMVKTGGNGYHLYYKHPGTPIKNGVRVAHLVDIRGDGGFVVAPPSVSNKGRYTAITGEEQHTALYPVELMQSLQQTSADTKVLAGERNIAATQKAGEILGTMSAPHQRSDALALLQQWNQTEVAEPLPSDEITKVFNSIAQREASKEPDGELILRPFTLGELYAEEFPEIQWLVKGLIPLGMMAAITGESNSYKSFITQALAYSVATGSLFLGHFPVAKGKVLIVDEENNKRIINDRFKAMGVRANNDIVFLTRIGIQLDNPKHLVSLQRVMEQVKPTMVVLDSLIRFHNKDENSATEMRKVMRAIGDLVNPECTVIFIHHHKKEQGFGRSSGSGSVRGSTDIFNALDCHIGIVRGEGSLKIKQQKLRVQPEMEMFKVNFDTQGEHLSFMYDGIDTTKQDRIKEAKQNVLELLQSTGNQELTRKEIITALGCTNKVATDALKELTDVEITCRSGKNNTHFYSLGVTADESTQTEPE